MVSPTCVSWTSNRLVFVMDTGEWGCDSSPGPATQSLSLLCRPEEGEEGALVPRHMSALISKSRRSNIIEESSLFGAIVAVACPSVSSVYPFSFWIFDGEGELPFSRGNYPSARGSTKHRKIDFCGFSDKIITVNLNSELDVCCRNVQTLGTRLLQRVENDK